MASDTKDKAAGQDDGLYIDVELVNRVSDTAETTEPPQPATDTEQASPGKTQGPDLSRILLDRMLRMAHDYRQNGKVGQASDLYWQLVEEHSGTPQAVEAAESLLKLAEFYENNDCQHTALGIYERLCGQQCEL
ncbi:MULTISPECIES: hypothetical protein [Ectothiorhodospira]|uniref:hypothetical protein n=1 Tax=Ectothiorhodospira TaxID=1051 RepID=UPI001EE918B2|nr:MULTISPECIES: hypothetical protein [Ectothiorhodospira]MCG5495767.1 hypothetical protein [Ectothiorhodospira variabilis]MCG5498552.1 hypothetical protein [Ectothiorhodospira variabilis]MCG5505206.1 hypothetical protein [Ectothiorhodospira variabilis]MCG5508357.1 hypothetical protein [Ectothiorhodospira variabilis]MCG5526131.1 hypothetical protein [Ectothiorhodospira haloalkaliphila]